MSTTPPTPPLTAHDVRLLCRAGSFRSPTAGLCPRQVQANILILPSKYADDFRRLCRRNPVACPLLGETRAPGDARLHEALAGDADVRTDAPGYNVYENGILKEADVPDCKALWKDDSVAFFIGCSFTFEAALCAANLTPRHIEQGTNVPMYRTNIPLCPSGIFTGHTVVSMRPYPAEQVELVRSLTRPYVRTHGEPIAWGPNAAASLGIPDIYTPDFGDAPAPLKEGEVPVFWACGVTPQLAVMQSPGVEGVVVGHAPGKMICLDMEVGEACV